MGILLRAASIRPIFTSHSKKGKKIKKIIARSIPPHCGEATDKAFIFRRLHEYFKAQKGVENSVNIYWLLHQRGAPEMRRSYKVLNMDFAHFDEIILVLLFFPPLGFVLLWPLGEEKRLIFWLRTRGRSGNIHFN